jgi:hypothetical protein
MGKASHLSTIEPWKVVGRSLLWGPDCRLLRRWTRSTVELLLLQLELPLLVLRAVAPLLV